MKEKWHSMCTYIINGIIINENNYILNPLYTVKKKKRKLRVSNIIFYSFILVYLNNI